MTTTWPFSVAAAAAIGAALRGSGRGKDQAALLPADLDIATAGQLFALAAEWLRAGNTESTGRLLDLIPADAWAFARDEVIAAAPEPRIAAMSDRMAADALLASPVDASPAFDRLTQVETLNAIAQTIRTRTRPAR